ncbi:hypothetical protein RUM43_005308 [Polyplax serrata]|uniref:EF-hand domain-containing protein n=1 Tax=Polyplax serrata TaxID=468196 RepID=A0AAN8S4N7_POLSC
MNFDKSDEEDAPSARYAPERLEVLCRRTGLEKNQLRALYRAFKEACPSGAINEFTFRNIYSQLFPLGADGTAYAHYIFKTLDKKHNGCLTFSELACGLACLVKGSPSERLGWIFRLYDIDNNGEISRAEMLAVIGAIHDLVGPRDGQSHKHANEVFRKLDLNSDGVITMDEFMSFCFNDEDTRKSFETLTNW